MRQCFCGSHALVGAEIDRMLVVLGAVGILGTALTFLGLWDFGWPLAFACAPIGGSIAAVVAGLAISYGRPVDRTTVPNDADVRHRRGRRWHGFRAS
jgi:hypothetical protein